MTFSFFVDSTFEAYNKSIVLTWGNFVASFFEYDFKAQDYVIDLAMAEIFEEFGPNQYPFLNIEEYQILVVWS